ncbi:hypothetical protein NMY22_g1267 [Coprinellus aureogranulatus]|nr:hypothetical protein NMY22_g1267 [Coprinellus aureogranulatus]
MPSSPSVMLVGEDSPIAMLEDYDTVFLVDDSGSMVFPLECGTRFDFARRLAVTFAELAANFDEDGIDIHFLNTASSDSPQLKTREEINGCFASVQVGNGTPLARRMKDLINPYLKRLKESGGNWSKKRNYIVLTDGAPDAGDEDILKAYINDTAQFLYDSGCPFNQIGIQFVQIGDDALATRFLRELDDSGFKRDFVDTVKPQSQAKPRKGWKAKLGIAKTEKDVLVDQTIKALLGGISRTHDDEKEI